MARQRGEEFCSPPKAPVFEPTLEEFKDPLGYINKIRPAAERVGICKIRPPPDWTPPFAVDLESFKFVPRVQRLNELEAHSRVKMNFLAALAKFWELQGSSLKRPHIEGYPLDLHELWKVVMEEGGCEYVNVAKKWSHIAKKMGYKKLQHSSFSLRQHYEKILYPYCVFRAVEMSEVKEPGPTQTRGYATSAMSTHSLASTQREKKMLRSTEGTSEHVLLDENNHVMAVTPVDKPAICKVCDKRSDKERLLVCDNCLTCIHTFCLITPLPAMPRGGWQCPSCIAAECSKKQESYGFEESKQVYTLETFGEMANRYKCDYFQISSQPQSVPTERMEKEFWRLVETSDDSVVVQYGADLHTSKHGSGFPFGNRVFTDEDIAYAESPWNLNNLPNLKGSVLGHVTADISGMKVPWLYVGMAFSSFCWHNEDHWSYSINYLHWGEPKTWYGVPGHSAEKFEKVMESAVPELFRDHPDLLHHLVTLVSPTLLMKNKVPVVSTNQCAGEFVVTFPRAYHAGFNQGFNLAEAVNFCPADWIRNGRACVDYYREMRRYTVFSHDELICRMAINLTNLDLHIAEAVDGDLAVLLERETQLRDTVAKEGITKEECESFELLPDDERQCCYCQALSFLSGVSCSCSSDRVVCLHHMKELCSCAPSEKTLRYRYSLPEIQSMKSRVAARAEEYVSWTKTVERLLDAEGDDRPTIEDLKLLSEQAKEDGFTAPDLKEELQLAITESEECAAAARELLEKKTLSADSEQPITLTLDDLKKFINKLDNLPTCIEEGDRIQSLLQRVAAFQVSMDTVMSDPSPPYSKLAELLEEAKTIDVDIPQMATIEQKLHQAKWLDSAQAILTAETGQADASLEEVEQLIATGQQYTSHPGVEMTLQSLQDMVSLSKHWEQKAKVLVEEKPTISHLASVISEASSLPIAIPALDGLNASLAKAMQWSREAIAIQDSDISPDLEQLEVLLSQSRSIPLQLEQLAQIESLSAAAQGWRDRASRAFLKKSGSSSSTLLQVLYPRVDRNQRLQRDSKPLPPNLVSGTRVMNVADEAALLAQLSAEELGDLRLVRQMHITSAQASHESLVRGEMPAEQHCVCRRTMAGVMLMCELCLDWFHTSCLHLPRSKLPTPTAAAVSGVGAGKDEKSSSQISNQPSVAALKENKFMCTSCVRSRKPRLDTVLSLLVSLRKVPVQLVEGAALQSLTERAMQWQERCRTSLAEAAAMLEGQNPVAAPAVLNALQLGSSSSSSASSSRNSSAAALISRSQPLPPGLVAAATQAAPCKSQLRSTAPLGRPSSSSNQNQMAPVIKTPTLPLPLARPLSSVEVLSCLGLVSLVGLNSSSVEENHEAGSAELRLAANVRGHLEELMMQGDLLEVAMDETQQLWQLLHLCVQTKDSVITVVLPVLDQTKEDRKRKKKRRHDDDEPDLYNEVLLLKTEASPAACDNARSATAAVETLDVTETSGEPERKRCCVRRQAAHPSLTIGTSTSSALNTENVSVAMTMSADGTPAHAAASCSAAACQLPAGNTAGWVQCQQCSQWLHVLCVGLVPDADDTVEVYTCVTCAHAAPSLHDLAAVGTTAIVIPSADEDKGDTDSTHLI